MSQSLLHQVTYSDRLPNGKLIEIAWMSQSLLHQVTYSDKGSDESPVPSPKVSQSLLHQVTYSDIGEGFLPIIKAVVSQSLLHQVTYSDRVRYPTDGRRGAVSIPFTSGHVFRLSHKLTLLLEELDVSIPFTSGHVFRPFVNPWGRATEVRSQSLLHQVTYSDYRIDKLIVADH